MSPFHKVQATLLTHAVDQIRYRSIRRRSLTWKYPCVAKAMNKAVATAKKAADIFIGAYACNRQQRMSARIEYSAHSTEFNPAPNSVRVVTLLNIHIQQLSS